MNEVSAYLKQLDHPRKLEIDTLRKIILAAHPSLEENIKWNGPNFHVKGEDRITMRIHPPKQVQLIFHRGAKPLPLPAKRLIQDDAALLVWKANDRAVMTFKNKQEIEEAKEELVKIVKAWIKGSSSIH